MGLSGSIRKAEAQNVFTGFMIGTSKTSVLYLQYAGGEGGKFY